MMTLMIAPVVNIFDEADYEAAIQTAANKLAAPGGVVVLPTETVYGAAGVLSDPRSVARLKGIRAGKAPPSASAGDGAHHRPFTIHLARRESASRYLGSINEIAQRLMKKLWPGPVSLVFDVPPARRAEVARQAGVAESELYSAAGTITLRCPDHVVFSDVVERLGERPVVLTVAGTTPQGPAQSIAQELGEQVDLIIDAGPTRFNKPSTILRISADSPRGYEIVRAGVYDERIIERLLRTTILFICSGNTCRSPMAEALARAALAKKLNIPADDLEKQKGIIIASAGSSAMPGSRATPQAVEAVKPLGGDLSRHRSRPLTVELIHQADAIFTMSRDHAQAVLALVPSARDKTMTLDPRGDIDDPIGGDLSLYQVLAGQMQQLVEKRLEETVQG